MLISSCYFLNKTRTHLVALVTEKYDIFNYVLLKAFFAREWLLMKVTLSLISLIVFLRTQMPYGTQADGGKFFRTLFFCLINVMFNGMAKLAMIVQASCLLYIGGFLVPSCMGFLLANLGPLDPSII